MLLTHGKHRGRRKNEEASPIICYLESIYALGLVWVPSSY